MSMNASRRQFLRTASVLSSSVGAAGLPFALNLAALGAASAQTTDYKAIVCLFLFGGNDAANMVLPTDADSWNAYTTVRNQSPDRIDLHPAGMARNTSTGASVRDYLGGVLPISPAFTRSPENSTRSFALHPAMAAVQSLFNSGRLGIIANAGPLIEPLENKAAYRNAARRKPHKLFSHNDQQSTWQALGPEGARVGWGGRLGDLMASQNASTIFTNISVSGNAVFLAGNTVFQYQVGTSGAVAIGGLPGISSNLFGSAAAGQALRNIITADNHNLFAKEHAAIVRRSVQAQAQFQSAFEASIVADPPQYENPATRQMVNNGLARQLQAVARIIKARSGLGVRRQIFFVSMGGFDTHDNQNRQHADLMARLSAALGYFDEVLGTDRNHVVLFTASDFGRTFTSNGDGTDHGWGGHHFVYGAVRGREIYGRFPQIGLNHDDEVGSGSFLPQVSVDQIGATLGQWFGVSSSDLNLIFPNLANFPSGVRNLGFVL